MSTKQEILALTVYELSGLAGCGDPDDRESPGAAFLANVRASVVEAWEYQEGNADAVRDNLWETADGAPSVYTHERWRQFVDLQAYSEDPDVTDEWPDDLTQAAGIALYQVADRLAHSLVNALEKGTEDE